jgi:hypothetical protein
MFEKPRVLGRRAGVFSRAGLLGGRLGLLANTHQQCQMWQVGGCACCWAHWGGLQAGNCIFWG